MDEQLAATLLEVTGAERVVGSAVVQQLWSGYGQILRCQLEGGPHRRVIVKHVRWPTRQRHPRGWNGGNSHDRKVTSYEVESAWYQRHAERCDETCRVPRCLALRRRGDEVFIVLEDLDDAGFPQRRTTVTDLELRACLGWLANFHARFLGPTPEGLWPVGTYWHLATRPDELAALADGPLKRAAARIDRRLSDTPFGTVVHGDAKLANFCFSADGRRVAAVDFQYVGGGCGMKDVAYFLGSCLDEDECAARESELLDLYFQDLRRAVAARDDRVDFTALQRSWRPLYALAWTDFVRFLRGWSPGHWKLHRYSQRITDEVLASL